MSQTSSHPCSGPACLDGNCIGCRNGNLWCGDPRCSPHCPNCPSNKDTWSVVVIIIIVIIALILICIVIWIAWHSSKPAKLTPIHPIQPIELNNVAQNRFQGNPDRGFSAPSGSLHLRQNRPIPSKNSNLPGNVKISGQNNPLANATGQTHTSTNQYIPLKNVVQPTISTGQPLRPPSVIPNNMIGGNLRF